MPTGVFPFCRKLLYSGALFGSYEVDVVIPSAPADPVIILYSHGLSLRMIAVCSACCCSAESCWKVVPCGIPARDITCVA